VNAAARIVNIAGATLLAVALLLPPGDAPWFSFWREWTAAAAILLMVLGAVNTLRDLGLPLQARAWSLPTCAAGLAAICWLQHAGGLLAFRADALVPSLYLVGFAVCIVATASLPSQQRAELADRIATAFLVAALVSAPLAILQWVGWLRLDMGIRVAGGRPVAHMEQANLLCSLAIQGVLAAWRLTERHRLDRRLGLALAVPLLLTIVLTQSRVAWLVGICLVGAVLWQRKLIPWRSSGRIVVAGVLGIAIGALLLPAIDSHFGIAGATLAERASEGRRPAIWGLFLDAVLARPWLGWGVLQNGAAQYAMSEGHSAAGWYFSSAHDIVLDLMVWFGVPVGLMAGVALLWAVARRVAGAPDAPSMITAAAAGALVLHALVELPLHYAYFLFPLGLLLGTGSPPANSPSKWRLRVPAGAGGVLPVLALGPALVLAQLASEYTRLSDVRPILDFDKTIGHSFVSARLPIPDVVLLDQLQAFHAFATVPMRPGTSAAVLEASRLTMLRLPYGPVIERHALLAGINARTDQASEALRRLCRFEVPSACEESERAWSLWKEQWPQLPPWPGSAEAR
jgi:O-antigen ligase